MPLQEKYTICDFSNDLQNLIEIKEKYYQLLYQVSMVHPNETRHETALRYIRQAENQENVPQSGKTLY